MQSSSQAVRAKEDEPFLERFIEAYEGFILRTASRHAGHTVTRSDDEYSVALMAFYEAVKGYDPAGGPFGAEPSDTPLFFAQFMPFSYQTVPPSVDSPA